MVELRLEALIGTEAAIIPHISVNEVVWACGLRAIRLVRC